MGELGGEWGIKNTQVFVFCFFFFEFLTGHFLGCFVHEICFSLFFWGAFFGMFFLYETSFWVGIYRRKWRECV